MGLLDQFNSNLEEITDFDNLKQYVASEGVNKPKLLDGMTPIKFNFNAEKNKYEEVDTNENDANWYNYTTTDKQWANAQTEDGSMWVWIPRYAYRINNDSICEVVFLVGSTDNYYDENGNLQTAKRAKSATEIVDTTTGYTVHPAFTDETGISYANGGWDEELTGIWVAKFEAAYATNKNVVASKINVPSTVNYTQAEVYAPALEAGTEGWITARNHVDGEYGSTVTAIKYPTFQGSSYAMNYINMNDAYNISRALTGSNNIYGLNGSNADSHLMKNSEWGAVAYLGKSDYGLNGTNIYINNVNLNNQVTSVYAVTGCSAKNTSTNGDNPNARAVTPTVVEEDLVTREALETKIQTVAYTWNQTEGGQASTTGTVYGVYDMSGGTWERTAGYVANGHENLKLYGASVAYNGDTLKTVSTKYTTVYPHDSSIDNSSATNIDTTSTANYSKNIRIYGDAVRETSTAGVGSTGWNGDDSYFWSLRGPFPLRGGSWNSTSGAGVSAVNRTLGNPNWSGGLRPVVVAQ